MRIDVAVESPVDLYRVQTGKLTPDGKHAIREAIRVALDVHGLRPNEVEAGRITTIGRRRLGLELIPCDASK